MKEITKIPLEIDFQNPTASNPDGGAAILYYQYDFSNHKGHVTAHKEAFQEVSPNPGMVEAACFSQSDELLRYAQDHSEELTQLRQSTQPASAGSAAACTVTNAILYSTDGFSYRTIIQQELKDAMERRNLRWCCWTCGLAICFAGCCGCRSLCDAEEREMNEHSYCQIIRERFPDQAQLTVAYQFL